MKKLLAVVLVLVLTLAYACSRISVEEDELVTIKFLYSQWPPDLMAYLAQEKGFFNANGVDVDLIKIAGYEEMRERRARIDSPLVWSYTILDFVKEFASNGTVDAQIFLVEDYSSGADAILASQESGITRIQEMKGAVVGVEQDTASELFLHIMLNKNGLSFDDIEIAHIISEDIPKALADGSIDVGVAYEPSVAESLSAGAVKLVDSSEEKNAIVDVLVARADDLAEYTEEYRLFTQAFLEAVEYFEENPEESLEIMSEAFGTSEEELANSFDGIVVPNLHNNQIIFQRSSGADSLYILLRRAQNYLEDQGFEINESIFDDLVNPQCIC